MTLSILGDFGLMVLINVNQLGVIVEKNIYLDIESSLLYWEKQG
jgi:hypothetical protein